MDDELSEKIEEMKKEFGLDDRCKNPDSNDSIGVDQIESMNAVKDRLRSYNEALANALIFMNKEITRLNNELIGLKIDNDRLHKAQIYYIDEQYEFRRIIEKLIADRDQKKAEIEELKSHLANCEIENRVLKNEDVLTGSVGDKMFMKMDENNDE